LSGTYQSTSQPSKRRGTEGNPVGGRLDGKHAQKHAYASGFRKMAREADLSKAHQHIHTVSLALSRARSLAFMHTRSCFRCAHSLALMCPLVVCLSTSENGESLGSEQDLARVRIVFLGLLLLDHWPCPRRTPCELKTMTCVPRFRSVAPRPWHAGQKGLTRKILLATKNVGTELRP